MPDEQVSYAPDAQTVSLERLVENEKVKLKEFFGYDIAVPAPPAAITPELWAQWQKLGFELHYLPAEELGEERDLPGWKKKPGARYMPNAEIGVDLFGEVERKNLPADTLKLPGLWILTDSRKKPQYDDGKQMYEKDPLSQVLKDLRKKRFIGKNKASDYSRFNITWSDLDRRETRAAIGEALRLPAESLRLPRAIEWNYLANAFHPNWGETSTWEWFEDAYYDGLRRLGGGGQEYGGISSLFCGDPETARSRIGFRPLAVFPNKTNGQP